MKYYFYAALAWARGVFVRWPKTGHLRLPTTTTGLNGKGEAKIMFEKHGWIPYLYQRTPYGTSRTFITK